MKNVFKESYQKFTEAEAATVPPVATTNATNTVNPIPAAQTDIWIVKYTNSEGKEVQTEIPVKKDSSATVTKKEILSTTNTPAAATASPVAGV